MNVMTSKDTKVMSDEDKKYYEIGSISKVCVLIEMLSTKKSWELSELCRAVGMPKTTVHRMLLTLADNGYVVQEKQRGEYSLSFKLFSISSRVINHSQLVDIARPFCKELLESVDETVNLCVVSGTEMLVIDKQVTSQTLRQDSIIGSSFSLIQSASGRVFLAFSDEKEADKLLKLSLEKHVPRESIETFSREAEKIKKAGLAHDYGEVFQGVRCVAAPIFNHEDAIAATLSVSVPVVRLNNTVSANIEKHLLTTAGRISQRLGASSLVLSKSFL